MKVTALLKLGRKWIAGHGPQLATGFGIAFGLTATITAAKATPKAIKKLEEKEKEKGEPLTITEKVKTAGPCYIPTAAAFTVSTGLIIAGHHATARKAAAFATAYSLSEQMLQEYKAATKEIVGEAKEKEITDKVAAQQVANNPPAPQMLVVTGKGRQICLDSLSQHYFYSNSERIQQAAKRLNDRFVGAEDFIPLTDWYFENDITEASGMEIAKDIGFNRDDGPITVEFTSTLGTGDFENIPILVVGFKVRPKPCKNAFGELNFS